MKNVFLLLLVTVISSFFLFGCSEEEEEKINPEDTLSHYIESWESHEYGGMMEVLSEESLAELSEQEWSLPERMEKVYGDLSVDSIAVSFESRNFEEEELDFEEIEELRYLIDVTMSSIAGNLRYETEVILKKVIELDENEEEIESWTVDWSPSHLFVGLEKPTDGITIQSSDPERGQIFDRNGNGLAINGEIYQVGFFPEMIEDFDDATERVAELFDLDIEYVQNMANQYPNNPGWFAPVQSMPLSDERRMALQQIKGVQVNRVSGREYPQGESLSQLVGYIGAITAEELEQFEGQGYHAHSNIGKRGLESVLEERLRGERGITISTVDEAGNTRHVVIKKEPVDGEDITLTIDAKLQAKLAETIGDEQGSAVVMNPTSGEVLALLSVPSYNSNYQYLRMKDPRTANLEDMNVLFERRFQNAYSPGSVFKPITAAIGIEEGMLNPTEELEITEKRWQPNDSWGDYRVTRVTDTVTSVDLKTGMKFSDNIYFAQKALDIGADTMESWAEAFGFGEPIPFEFPMYSSSIANDGINSEILLADTGYGQGQVQMTPLHLTALYTMFINEGSIVQPFLYSEEAAKGAYWKENIITADTAATILETMIAVVEEPNGTAHRQGVNHSRVIAGKTGTAELKDTLESEDGKELGWYVALDYEQKDILVTVMIEHVEELGGSGYVVDLVNEFLSLID
ncbi:penicillin-binding transpeptidase domain-containing protein [Evansella sp. AB-rgal1]|uniref:penicillin-binding transpeptidase domain-containing protein n=1 Tax=Evansella sp. AB-rgal1 TaxID=3242696 RepID=UPI00359D9E95